MYDLRKAMFDLEKSFANWRWQMLAAGIKAPELVEELESHLREEVELQLRTDADVEQAFATAVQRLGEPGELNREFGKARGWGFRFWWIFLGIGGFGLGQTAMLNLVGPLVFHRHSSAFFSAKWWSDWFPSYIVWITFIIVGSALILATRPSRRKAASV
jgi:hypothetical protein